MFADAAGSGYTVAGAYHKGGIYLTDIPGLGTQAIVHEMGHFLDDYSAEDQEYVSAAPGGPGNVIIVYRGTMELCASDQPAFAAICQAEAAGSTVTDYEKSDIHEYFAGSFSKYVHNPAELQAAAPATFLYIRSCMEALGA